MTLKQQIELGRLTANFSLVLEVLLLLVQVDQQQLSQAPLLQAYEKMFDVALSVPAFGGEDQGIFRISYDLVACLLKQDQEPKQLVTEYLHYLDRLEHHFILNCNRVRKSEGYRINSSVNVAKNKTLIMQYFKSVNAPEFALTMLNDYWVGKMSLVQDMTNTRFQDWQFYWHFVTRLARYFKSVDASQSESSLNAEHEFLIGYFIKEVGDIHIDFENRKFLYAFKQYHLDNLSRIAQKKQAKSAAKPYSNPIRPSLPTKTAARPSHINVPVPKVGDCFWYKNQDVTLPCELVLQEQGEYVFTFDYGRHIFSLSVEEYSQAVLVKAIVPRYNFEYYHAQRLTLIADENFSKLSGNTYP